VDARVHVEEDVAAEIFVVSELETVLGDTSGLSAMKERLDPDPLRRVAIEEVVLVAPSTG
jgi:hypothetical protein